MFIKHLEKALSELKKQRKCIDSSLIFLNKQLSGIEKEEELDAFKKTFDKLNKHNTFIRNAVQHISDMLDNYIEIKHGGCGHMFIKLNNNVDPHKINAELENRNIIARFQTTEEIQAWLDGINNNPNHPNRHVKPRDRNLTLDELKDIFKMWTVPGLLHADLCFYRTSKEQMQKLANFIDDYKDSIDYVTNCNLLIERGNLSRNLISAVSKFDKA